MLHPLTISSKVFPLNIDGVGAVVVEVDAAGAPRLVEVVAGGFAPNVRAPVEDEGVEAGFAPKREGTAGAGARAEVEEVAVVDVDAPKEKEGAAEAGAKQIINGMSVKTTRRQFALNKQLACSAC